MTLAEPTGDWDLAVCFEAMARASVVAGDPDAAGEWIAKARAVPIAEAEDNSVRASNEPDVSSGPLGGESAGVTRFFLFLLYASGGLAGYGYFMRFVKPGRGSMATLGAPIAIRTAPYFLAVAVLAAIAASVSAIL